MESRDNVKKLGTGGSKRGLPQPLIKLKQIVLFGFEQTAPLFAPIAVAYNWIHQAADILDNEFGHSVIEVKRSYQNLLAQMSQCQHMRRLRGSQVLLIFSKLLAVIGLDFFIVTKLRIYLEPIMILNILLVCYAIINTASLIHKNLYFSLKISSPDDYL